MRRARLLLPLEEELEVDRLAAPRRLAARRARSASRRSAICRRSPSAHRSAIPDRSAPPAGKRDLPRPLGQRAVAQHRLPGRRDPPGRIHRLPVVVRVEDHVRVAPGDGELAVDDRRGRPGASRSAPPAPRRSSIATINAALRRILTESRARFGIERNWVSSPTISVSREERHAATLARSGCRWLGAGDGELELVEDEGTKGSMESPEM